MNRTHATHKEALKAAVELARLCNREAGIRRSLEFGRDVYIVTLLPDPANRRGHELTAEIVRPTDPLPA